jgi:ATP-dependent RNA helicase SUPV3L1/SUV3
VAKPAADAAAAPAAEQTPQPQREKREGRDGHRRPPRGDKRQDRRDRPRHDGPRPQAKPDRARDKPIDPNSPFAALLELKARLEADQKEKG